MKEKFNKLWETIKNNRNASVAICVAILTVTTIGVSYSAFFTVKTNTSNQVITTGTLQVTHASSNAALTNKTGLIGLPDEEGLKSDNIRVIHIQNTGNLDANYALTLGYDMDNFLIEVNDTNALLTPLDFVRVAIYEYSDNTPTLIAGPLNISDLPVYKSQEDYRFNRYAVLFDSLGATSNNTKNYQIRIWLSDKATSVASNTYFYIASEIVAEANNTKMAYNISGSLVNTAGTALSGAQISIQNNSIVATTNASGAFTIPNILSGTYNVDITYNSRVYQGNLTIKEGSAATLVSKGSTFTGDPSLTLATVAYNYGTTISKIKEANNITAASSDYIMSSESYNLLSTYELTGGTTKDINNVVITLGDTEIINMVIS